MMKDTSRDQFLPPWLFHVLFWLISTLLLLWYLSISRRFPFFLLFDMDQTATLDTVSINDGKLPDLMFHTTYGLYLVTSLMSRALSFLGFVPPLSGVTLENAINPYFLLAQWTDFLRTFAPFIAWLTSICIACFCRIAFGISRWATLGALVVIGTLEAFTWQSALIKSEQYSVLFYCFSILAFVWHLKASSRLWLFVSGIFWGLGFITKVQSFFFGGMMGVVALILLRHRPSKVVSSSEGNFPLGSCALFSALVGFSIYASRIEVVGPLTGAQSFGTNAFFLLFAFATIVPALFFLIRKICPMLLQSELNFWQSTSLPSSMTLFFTGALASFLSHLLLFSNGSTGWQYLIYDFRLVFHRQIVADAMNSKSLLEYLQELGTAIQLSPYLSAITILSGTTAYLCLILRKHPNRKRDLSLLGLLTGAWVLNGAVAVRNWNSDVIWFQIASVFFIATSVFYVTKDSYPSPLARAGAGVLALLVCAFLFIGNIERSILMIQNIEIATSQYGWARHASLNAVYGFNQPYLADIARNAYAKSALRVAESSADTYRHHLVRAQSLLPSQIVETPSVGLAQDGFRAGQKSQAKIHSGGAFGHDATWVDIKSTAQRKLYPWSKEGEAEGIRIRSNFQFKRSNESRIAVIPRRDLSVFILSDRMVNELAGATKCSAKVSLELSEAKQPLLCWAIERSHHLSIQEDQSLFLVAQPN